MARINEVEIKKQSWMQVIVNEEDGYINGTKLAEQIGISLYRFLKIDDVKESIENITILTSDKEKYQGDSPWDNIKGMYIHPFLALEMVAIKKHQDTDYNEYYEFLKETIFEFLDNHKELKEEYFFLEEFHG